MNIASLPEIMVAIAAHRALPEVLRAVVEGIAACRDVVLTRIWLFGPGDQCASCRFAEECSARERCLHLVASAGNATTSGFEPDHLHGAFRRFPHGVRKIGRVAARGEPMLLPELRGDEPWIVDAGWIGREGVRAFAAQPLLFGGEVLGVLALFDRRQLDDDDCRWLRVFADHAAVSIAHARAFEEIERLRLRLQSENAYLREEVSQAHDSALIAESPGMRRVLRQVDIVADSDATVLISGETGSGKEVVARALHARSRRRRRPLIRVNCGAVPEKLFESEFFGHARGAFTGALKERVGRFELADGGTLFLDEVGEIPLALQPKLLRVLQEQELERVGESRTRAVDVRVIAATNRDLRAEVEAGRFRQDLYYRLSVFPIRLPPLRERKADIAPLAEHFLRRRTRPGQTPRLAPEALARLEACPWPGNVRELENAVERALLLAPRGPLRFDGLGAPPADVPVEAPRAAPRVRTQQEMRALERDNLVAALRQCRGKLFGADGAAALLAMKPTTLASRLKSLGIDRHQL